MRWSLWGLALALLIMPVLAFADGAPGPDIGGSAIFQAGQTGPPADTVADAARVAVNLRAPYLFAERHQHTDYWRGGDPPLSLGRASRADWHAIRPYQRE